MSPKREMRCPGNMFRTMVMDSLAVCAVTPSCWNHTLAQSPPTPRPTYWVVPIQKMSGSRGSPSRKYMWEKQMQLAQVTVQTWQFVVFVTNLRASWGAQCLDDLWRCRDFQEVHSVVWCVSWCVMRSLAVCLHLTRQGNLETCFRGISYFKLFTLLYAR